MGGYRPRQDAHFLTIIGPAATGVIWQKSTELGVLMTAFTPRPRPRPPPPPNNGQLHQIGVTYRCRRHGARAAERVRCPI